MSSTATASTSGTTATTTAGTTTEARLNAQPSFFQKAKDAAAALVQGHTPVNQLSLHLISLPCYAHSFHHQRLTHHYCHRYSEDFWQCVMYDGSTAHSRLIGVEFVIGEKTFQTLPEEEKVLWHSHAQEIRGGNTIAPGLPETAEHSVMAELANTYGKAIHFWAAQDPLPYGPPKLIYTMCTPEKQAELAEASVWKDKDESSGISSADRARKRTDIDYHPRLAGSDQWERGGEAYEFVAVPVKHSAEIVQKYQGIRNQYRDN